MNNAVNDNITVDDKTTMRRLGFAVLAMCAGAIGVIILAISIGHLQP